jgi:adenylosuccinate lyase
MHEIIREHSVAAGFAVKNQGLHNNLLELLAKDDRIPFTIDEINGLLGDYQQFTGRAAMQTTEFLEEEVAPVLERYKDIIEHNDASLTV